MFLSIVSKSGHSKKGGPLLLWEKHKFCVSQQLFYGQLGIPYTSH